MNEMVSKAKAALYRVITSDPLGVLVQECGLQDVVSTPKTGNAPVEDVLVHPYSIS